jgi:hypothetical protein
MPAIYAQHRDRQGSVVPALKPEGSLRGRRPRGSRGKCSHAGGMSWLRTCTATVITGWSVSQAVMAACRGWRTIPCAGWSVTRNRSGGTGRGSRSRHSSSMSSRRRLDMIPSYLHRSTGSGQRTGTGAGQNCRGLVNRSS